MQKCIFDGFNDLRNLQTAIRAANKEKGHAQIALSYMLDYWEDTAMYSFSMEMSQSATEVMVVTFKGTEYDTGLDQNFLAEIADYFRPMQEERYSTRNCQNKRGCRSVRRPFCHVRKTSLYESLICGTKA